MRQGQHLVICDRRDKGVAMDGKEDVFNSQKSTWGGEGEPFLFLRNLEKRGSDSIGGRFQK